MQKLVVAKDRAGEDPIGLFVPHHPPGQCDEVCHPL